MTHLNIAWLGLIDSIVGGGVDEASAVASSHKGNSRTLRSNSMIVEYVGVSAVIVRAATSATHSTPKRIFQAPSKRVS